MSIFFAFLKRILGLEDDKERQIGHQLQRPREYAEALDPNRRDGHSSARQSYYVFDRESVHETVSRTNAPLSGANIGQTTNSSRAHNNSCPSQAHSTYVLNRGIIDWNSVRIQLPGDNVVNPSARDATSGASASKQLSIPKRENIDNNLVSIKPSGNNKEGNGPSQIALASSSCSLKPPSVTAKPSPSSVSEKPTEIHQKPALGSSGSTGSIHPGANANKGTNSSYFSSAASKQLQSSTRFSVSSDCSVSSPSTFETGKTPTPTPAPRKANEPSSSSLFGESHSPKPPPLSVKPTISLALSNSLSPNKKTAYVWLERDASSTYVFPKEIKSLIEKDVVPGVLKIPLSKSSYKDYFHALLYAEDCYLEKWDGFEMKNVKVELHEAAIYTKRGKNRNLNEDDDKDEKVFITFELDEQREMRPFLVSRDSVYLQPSNQQVKTFQGVIYRVVKSNLVLAEFGEDFHSHHHANELYNVKFSFNRVCLKRAHQAVAAASDSLFKNLVFPDVAPKHELPSTEHFAKNKYELEAFAVRQILRLQGAPPYLVEGPLVIEKNRLSRTGVVIVEAILGIIRADPSKKILLCAPVNRACDLLMRGLKKEIDESDMFRANAVFRELDGVPLDILPSCLYAEEKKCFSCPSLKELKKYKVILTTFMSSFRLYGEGIKAGHFSHIFLVDASSATEPETMVPLANFITDETIVVVSGAPRNHSGWIRSKIARENGLRTSYFERLCDSGMYKELDPKVIVLLEDRERGTNETRISLPSF